MVVNLKGQSTTRPSMSGRKEAEQEGHWRRAERWRRPDVPARLGTFQLHLLSASSLAALQRTVGLPWPAWQWPMRGIGSLALRLVSTFNVEVRIMQYNTTWKVKRNVEAQGFKCWAVSDMANSK